MTGHWLIKSDPEEYTIEDLERDGETAWDGVRNFQARNFLRDRFRPGDRVLFYHSNAKPPGVVGLAEVVSAGYPDETALDPNSAHPDPRSTKENPIWFLVDLAFREKWEGTISLERLGQTMGLEDMLVTKRSRLSVQPVTKKEFDIVVKLGRAQKG